MLRLQYRPVACSLQFPAAPTNKHAPHTDPSCLLKNTLNTKELRQLRQTKPPILYNKSLKEHHEVILSTHTLFQTGVQREHIREI